MRTVLFLLFLFLSFHGFSKTNNVNTVDIPKPYLVGGYEEDTLSLEKVDMLQYYDINSNVTFTFEGSKRNGCFGEIQLNVERKDNIYTIIPFTRRPVELKCSKDKPVSVSQTVDLGKLDNGKYTLKIFSSRGYQQKTISVRKLYETEKK